MEKQLIRQAVDRIQEMEIRFDILQKALKTTNGFACSQDWFRSQMAILLDYYENGLWLADYHLDEQGHMPNNLKRGVLSEDGVYNFLTEIQQYQQF